MVGGKFKKDSSGGPNAASPGVSGGFLYFNVQYGLCTEEMIDEPGLLWSDRRKKKKKIKTRKSPIKQGSGPIKIVAGSRDSPISILYNQKGNKSSVP